MWRSSRLQAAARGSSSSTGRYATNTPPHGVCVCLCDCVSVCLSLFSLARSLPLESSKH
jgi:hypothetical protein